EAVGHLVIEGGEGAASGLRDAGDEAGDGVTRLETEVARLDDENDLGEGRRVAAARVRRLGAAGGDEAAVDTAGVVGRRRVRLEHRRGAVPGHVHAAIV